MASGNTASLRLDSDKFKYSEGWTDRTTFDMTRLPLYDQEELGRVFGMAITMSSKPRGRLIDMHPYEACQVDYFKEVLDGNNYDITIRRHSKSDERDVVCVKNPAVSYHLTRPFPKSMGPRAEKAIIDGVVTGTAIRTKNISDMKGKLIWITGNKPLFDSMAPMMNVVTGIQNLRTEYKDNSRHNTSKDKTKYSVWFLDPVRMERYIFDNDRFGGIQDYLKELPNFATPEGAWVALCNQFNFMKSRDYRDMKSRGYLSTNEYDELRKHLAKTKRKINEAADILSKLRGDSRLLDGFDQKTSEEARIVRLDAEQKKKQLEDIHDQVYSELEDMRIKYRRSKPSIESRRRQSSSRSYNASMSEHAKDEYRTQ